MDKVYINNKDHRIDLYVWKAKNPKGIIQILHGMGEYVERYRDFALFLVKNNYTVVAHNHRGHGKNIRENEYGFFSKDEGWSKLTKDAKKVNDYIAIKYQNLDIYILGHSMGSFLLRDILFRYKTQLKVKGAIIMGTGNPRTIKVLLGYFLSSIIANVKGDLYKSKLLTEMTFKGYSDRFKNTSVKSWLTKDIEKLNEFRDYKFYNNMMPVNFYKNLYKGILNILKEKYFNVNTELFIISGQDDILGDFGKDIQKIIKKYSNHTVVRSKIYKGFRHEVLNEVNREMVYNDILEWLNN